MAVSRPQNSNNFNSKRVHLKFTRYLWDFNVLNYKSESYTTLIQNSINTMKALIQRVMNAKVTVNGDLISNIDQGMCVLIGICSTDTKKDMEYIVRKLLSIKLFDDESDKKWKNTVVEKQFEILCVSQFTLYNTWKGNKPDFHKAMPAEKSKEFYESFLQMLKDAYIPEKIKDGQFSAYMQVSIQNDGPVTFEIESPANLPSKERKSNNQPKKDKQTDKQGDQQTEEVDRIP